jgi:hypothetical protein
MKNHELLLIDANNADFPKLNAVRARRQRAAVGEGGQVLRSRHSTESRAGSGFRKIIRT